MYWGGSRARGTNEPDSDIDIGIYYDSGRNFNIQEVNRIAMKLDYEHRDNLITNLEEWGEWVNGGGWLIVYGYRVDLIFRDIKKLGK